MTRTPYITRCREQLQESMVDHTCCQDPQGILNQVLDAYRDVRAIRRHMNREDTYSLEQDVLRASNGGAPLERLDAVFSPDSPLEEQVREATQYLESSRQHWMDVDVPCNERDEYLALVQRVMHR